MAAGLVACRRFSDFASDIWLSYTEQQSGEQGVSTGWTSLDKYYKVGWPSYRLAATIQLFCLLNYSHKAGLWRDGVGKREEVERRSRAYAGSHLRIVYFRAFLGAQLQWPTSGASAIAEIGLKMGSPRVLSEGTPMPFACTRRMRATPPELLGMLRED